MSLSKDVEVKLKAFMRFAKALADHIGDEDYRGDFESAISNAIADYVAYIIDKEATITIDLEHETITIKR